MERLRRQTDNSTYGTMAAPLFDEMAAEFNGR
jgi:hypothetical protein